MPWNMTCMQWSLFSGLSVSFEKLAHEITGMGNLFQQALLIISCNTKSCLAVLLLIRILLQYLWEECPGIGCCLLLPFTMSHCCVGSCHGSRQLYLFIMFFFLCRLQTVMFWRSFWVVCLSTSMLPSFLHMASLGKSFTRLLPCLHFLPL